MLIFLIVVTVLVGLAYADYCLIDNTAHFGICYGKVAEAEESRQQAADSDADDAAASRPVIPTQARPVARPPDDGGERPLRSPLPPAPAWPLFELEPVLELREEAS